MCQAAGVTAPTLYRRFGDKGGLLDALAARGLDAMLAMKRGGRLALSYGVGFLATQAAARAEVEAVGRVLLDATLAALVHAEPDG